MSVSVALVYHRFGEDYLPREEGSSVPALHHDTRVAVALGREPLEKIGYLLKPVPLPGESSLLQGPNPGTHFLVDIQGSGGIEAGEAKAAFNVLRTQYVDFPRLWGRGGSGGSERWINLDDAPSEARFESISIVRELTAILVPPEEVAAQLSEFLSDVSRAVGTKGWGYLPREAPHDAARRASRLQTLRLRYGKAIEMRLIPDGRPFIARDVWRAAYSLGMEWGHMDLFHWNDRETGRRLFSLNAVGGSGYFLPERVPEGEAVPGVAFWFELPLCPAPLDVYDRMAVALAYMRQKLGGRPATSDGTTLDGERLYTDRDALEEDIEHMKRAGITPGSPAALRFF